METTLRQSFENYVNHALHLLNTYQPLVEKTIKYCRYQYDRDKEITIEMKKAYLEYLLKQHLYGNLDNKDAFIPLFPLMEEYHKVYDLYSKNRISYPRGKKLLIILNEVNRREEANESCTFTELQRFIFNLQYSLPDAYHPRLNRGYYTSFFITKLAYVHTAFGKKAYIYFKKENKNYRLNEDGYNKLTELAIKFSL